MLAIDTNAVVRYLTDDSPVQSAHARTLVDRNDVFAAKTVLLESEWVLRSVYGFKAGPLVDALEAFAGLPRVQVETPACVAKAFAWMRADIDFADALHLASAEECEAFVSFDVDFVAAATAQGGKARVV